MKKRLSAGILALLLIVGTLTGCGRHSAQQREDLSPAVSVPAEPAEPPDKNDAEDPLSSSEAARPADPAPESAGSTQNTQAALPEGSSFEVHFVDVGQGDGALVLCDGHAMLIDGGEAAASSKIYAYLKNHQVDYLDYIIATHAHSDHIGGLSGALNYATVGTALCPVTDYDSRAFDSFVKYLDRQNVAITVPQAGDTFSLGSAVVQILGPQKAYEEPNDTSIVLKISYGETAFLFTGDAERAAEADILDAGYDLSATVLKVGHHGSDTSTSYPFLREIMPEYAVISVGADNPYGHPTEATLSRLRDAGAAVYRTDLQGTIICTSDGERVTFQTERNENVQTNPTISPDSQEAVVYIGNKNSKKFHLPTCSTLPAEKNRVFFDSRQEAVDAGYDPCGNCKP